MKALTKFSVNAPDTPVNFTNVDPSERITRYVFDSNKFRSDNTVKHSVFMPMVYEGSLETSVYRTDGLSDAPLWKIGEDIGAANSKPLKGRADIIAERIFSAKSRVLRINPAVKDHPRHALIVGWPLERDAQRMLAVELANSAIGYRL